MCSGGWGWYGAEGRCVDGKGICMKLYRAEAVHIEGNEAGIELRVDVLRRKTAGHVCTGS